MIAGLFNSLAGVFKGFFSRAFWFSAFMPVALALALHIAVASLVFPKQVPLPLWLHAATKDNLAIFPLLSAGVIVLAYAMGPLAPVATGYLDGSRLPRIIQTALRRGRLRRAMEASEAMRSAGVRLARYAALERTQIDAMIAARQSGAAKGAPADPALARAAVASARLAAQRMGRGTLPDLASLGRAAAEMVRALASGTADANLSDAQEVLTRTAQRAALEARYQVGLVQDRFGPLTALAPPMATRLAEARRSAEAYSLDVYGVAFDFIWPRLWLVIPDKEGASAIISDAQSQVDFSVMSFWLLATVWAVWAPLIIWADGWRTLLDGGGQCRLLWTLLIAGPLLCVFFYGFAVASQWKLAQVTKATIDKHRIDLLQALLQPRPADRDAERASWRSLQLSEAAAGGGEDVAYTYTP